mmetsp:Transcript_27562/g.74999  ORF Transcript_27562/g.74999 Transcript_27562/m.74999 type:complete len:239 (-) Transcript_27562:1177-1893(-)
MLGRRISFGKLTVRTKLFASAASINRISSLASAMAFIAAASYAASSSEERRTSTRAEAKSVSVTLQARASLSLTERSSARETAARVMAASAAPVKPSDSSASSSIHSSYNSSSTTSRSHVSSSSSSAALPPAALDSERRPDARIFSAWIFKMAARPTASGLPISTWISRRPGRSTALSTSSRWLVRASTKVGTGRSATPSISASSWFTTESRVALSSPPLLPSERRLAIESNSSSTMT